MEDVITLGFWHNIFDIPKQLECESGDEEYKSELAVGILNPSL